MVARGLRNHVFTRGWCLCVTSPILWAVIDVAGSWTQALGLEAFHLLIDGLVIWLLCGPIIADFCTFLTCHYCQRARSTCGEVFINLGIVFLAALGFSAIVGSYFFCYDLLFKERWYNAAIFGCSRLLFAICHVLYKVSRTSHRFRFPLGPCC